MMDFQPQAVGPEFRAEPLRPFDHQRRMLARLVEPELAQRGRIFDAVEIDVPERQPHLRLVIDLDDREGRARHLAGKAEPVRQSARQSGLTGTKLAGEGDDIAYLQGPCERRPRRLGFALARQLHQADALRRGK